MMLQQNNQDDLGASDDLFNRITSSLSTVLKRIGEAYAANANADVIANVVKDVDDAAVRIAKSFGQGRENVLAMSQSMGNAVRDVTLLGGGFQNIADIQESVSRTLERNIILTSSSYKDLYAASKVAGVDAAKMVSSFKDAGFSAYQASDQMGKVVNVARSVGVNAQAVSAEVLENMDALNKYNFQGGVEGLAKMAAQASMLRINMRDSLNFAEKVFDPDGAIEVAAAMQRLGVANSELLDPLRLMDMAQNDPAELQNQMAKMSEQFVQLNKDGQFEIMPGAKRQMREIESAMGLPNGQLAKMAIAAKELDEKMSRIKFPAGAFTEDQQKMIANMAEMGKDGEFKIMVGGEELDLDKAIAKIEGMGADEREKFFEAQQPKSMEDLAKEQLTTLEAINANIKSLITTPYAIAGTKAAKDVLRAPVPITRGISDVLTGGETKSIANQRKLFDENSQAILSSIEKLAKGEGSMADLAEKVTNAGTAFSGFISDAAIESAEQYTKTAAEIANEQNSILNILIAAKKSAMNLFMDNENLNTNSNAQNTEIPVRDFVIKTLPEDKLVMAGGTFAETNDNFNSMMEKMLNMTSTNTNFNQPTENNQTFSNEPIKVEIKMDINAPTNIDTAQLALAMKDTGITQSIVDAVNMGMFNNGMTSVTSNPRQRAMMAKESTGVYG